MTYTNTLAAIAYCQPAVSCASPKNEARMILADFIEGKILSQDTDQLQLPTIQNKDTLRQIACAIYREYGIFSNATHYQDIGIKAGTHYVVGHVNSHTSPLQGTWLNLNDVINNNIPCPQKVKSVLEEIIYKIN